MRHTWILTLAALLALAACSPSETEKTTPAAQDAAVDTSGAAPAEILARAQAPLLDGLGDFNHPITTTEPWAQRYFNQGMMMAAGSMVFSSRRSWSRGAGYAPRLERHCSEYALGGAALQGRVV